MGRQLLLENENGKMPFAKQTAVGHDMKEHQPTGRCRVPVSEEMRRDFLGACQTQA